MPAQPPQAMLNHDIENMLNHAPITCTEPSGNGSKSNFSIMLFAALSTFFILLFSNSG
jgi:hypothetical protein